MATFIIGGIWHGAGWTFVFWGFLHGLALVIQRAWNQLGYKMNAILAWFITFNFVNIAWVFFRAKEWDDAIKVLSSMFSLDNIVLPEFLASKLSFLRQYGIEYGGWVSNLESNGGKILIPWLLAGFILILLFKNSNSFLKKAMNTWLMVLCAVLFSYAMVKSLISSTQVFLYFNF